MAEVERSCLCEQKIMDLHPSLSLDMLFINTPIVRNTGNKVRHRWKWTLQPSPNQFYSPPPIPKEIGYPLLSILKERTLSLLADYVVVQSNCSFRQNLVNCEVRSYDCVYSKGTPPDTPIHYDKAKGTFWQYHFHKKSCTTSPNHRWVSVCKSPCTSSNIVPENLQCCDVTKALWYGKNSGAYKSAYHSSCCSYGYNCYNLDIQYLWFRDTITCTVYGREMAFEPAPTDIVVQKEFDMIESLNQVQGFLKKWNKNQIKMPARVKVIATTTRKNAHNYRDGPIKMSDYHNQYLTYPSMVKGDKTCFQRVRNNAICNNLVGVVLQKLAFYDYVHFDPTQNKPKFPSSSVRLYESNGEISKPPDDPKRKQRQITGGVVLLTFLTSLVGNAITGTATGLTLQQEFDKKLNELESKINERFAQDEENTRTLSNRINSLETVNVVQDQAITRALI